MRPDRYRIVNRSASSVVVEDLRVHLPGRGDWAEVHAASADDSRDLPKVRHLVKLEPVRTGSQSVPIWPFIKVPPAAPTPTPAPAPAPGPRELNELNELVKSVQDIGRALQELLLRPSPAPADVVAAHVHAIGQRGGEIPAGLPWGPDPAGDPVFIPSRIVPEGTDADIQVREGEVRKDDFDEGVAALRRVRGEGR